MAEQELLKPVVGEEEVNAIIEYWSTGAPGHSNGAVCPKGMRAALNGLLQRRASKMSQQPPVAVTDEVKSLQARIAELEGAVEKEKKPLVVDDKMVDNCMKYIGYHLGDYRPFVKEVLCWYAHFVNGNLPVKDRFTTTLERAFRTRGWELSPIELKELVSELRRIEEEDR